MNRIERIACGLIKPINPYASVLLGIMTFMWGLWVVNPFWEVFTRAAVYSKAIEFAPEWAWGTWSTTCGLTIILALVKHSPVWVVRASGFAIWHWFTVSGMLWWGDWQNTAGLAYLFVGLYAVYVFLNIKVNWVRQGIKHF